MSGLAPCLVAAALVVAGCGSGNDNPSSAPKQEKVTPSGAGDGQPAAVSATGRATPASLCAGEGRGGPKKQCVAALKKLDRGRAANPRAACKGLSRKRAKGVRGKSPFAVCVTAAAKLMASRSSGGGGGNGSAGSNPGSSGSSGPEDGEDSSGAEDSSASDQGGIVCRDENGNVVPIDSDAVAECDLPDDASAGDSSSAGDSTGTGDSSGLDSSGGE